MPPWHADAPHGTFVNERRGCRPRRKTAHRTLGGGRRAAGQPRGSAAAPDVCRRLEHRHARSGVRAARRLRGPRARARFSTRTSTSRPDSPRRSGCRRSKRGRAIARWCITSSCTAGPARRSTGAAPIMVPNREDRHAAAGGRPAIGRRSGPGSDRRACWPRTPGHRSPGSPARHHPAPAAGRRAPVPDALHHQRRRRHRPIESRTDLRESSHRRQMHASAGFLNARRGNAPARRRRIGGHDRRDVRCRTRSCGACSRTRTCAARVGSTSSSGPTARARSCRSRVRLQLADVILVRDAARVPRCELTSMAWYDNSASNKSNPDTKSK